MTKESRGLSSCIYTPTGNGPQEYGGNGGNVPLVNLDQALRSILQDVFKGTGAVLNLEYNIMECMRRAYRMAEGKLELENNLKMLGEPDRKRSLKEEGGE